MSITPVLEALEDSPQAAATAHALIDALLTEEAALKNLDALMYPRHPDAAARKRSRQIFEAWHRWIADAEALLRQLRAMKMDDGLREHANRLLSAWAHGSNRVKMTLERLERVIEQSRRGEIITFEEYRRELRPRVGARREPEPASAGGVASGGSA